MNEQTLFTAAMERDPVERPGFLDKACGNNETLRERVEKLLRLHENAGDFLERPATGDMSTIDHFHTEQPGTIIGSYKLVEEIGEGGMGSVFMAVQKEPVRRKVALKVIKPGMDSKQVVSRFEAERQALAMMDHPNIARVFDGGATESGRPYFVMELVNGIPITDYCDRYSLTTNDRLELFGEVCRAVQHAHQKGIIHRDLKPSNILVTLLDSRAIPKVIDFGIAKAIRGHLTEESLVTHFAQMIGSPLYMSPEQAELSAADVDTRSDVYSLGVLLYELLTSTTPFDRERMSSVSFDEFRRIIREEEPPRPSTRLSTLDAALDTVADKHHTDPRTLSHKVAGELDWIVMKSLEKERAQRYESASALAADIERHLNDEPVEACPPSRAYRFRKFARRNKVAIVVTAIFLALLSGGIIGTTWQAVRATAARDQLQESERLATSNLELATKNLERALAAVDQLLTRVGDTKLRNVPLLEEVRRELLTDALTFYQQFLHDLPEDPQVQFETAAAHRRVAAINLHLGNASEAKKAIHQAIDIFRGLPAKSVSETKLDDELAQSRFLLGKLFLTEGDNEAAIKEYVRAVEILRRTVTDHPENNDIRMKLAFGLSRLAVQFKNNADPQQARTAFSEAAQLYEEGVVSGAAEPGHLLSYAKHLQNFGNFAMMNGEWPAAEERYRKAIEIAGSLLAREPSAEGRLVAAMAKLNLGNALVMKEEYDEAFETAERAIGEFRDLVRDYPSVPDYRLRLAGTLMTAGGYHLQRSRSDHGIPLTEEAVPLTEEAVTLLTLLTEQWPDVVEYHHQCGGGLHNLATLLKDRGRDLDRAEVLLKQAIECQSVAMQANPKDPDFRLFAVNHYQVLAELMMQRGRPKEASAACMRALEIVRPLAAELSQNAMLAEKINNIERLKQEAEGKEVTDDSR